MSVTLTLVTPGIQLGYADPDVFATTEIVVQDTPLTSNVYRVGSQFVQGDDWQLDWLTGGYADLSTADTRTVTFYEATPATGYTERYTSSTSVAGEWTSTHDLSGETGGRWWRIRTAWNWTGEGQSWSVDRYLYLLGDGGGAQGDGQVVSLFSYDRPEVQHVVWQTLNGDLVARQGPS